MASGTCRGALCFITCSSRASDDKQLSSFVGLITLTFVVCLSVVLHPSREYSARMEKSVILITDIRRIHEKLKLVRFEFPSAFG